MAKISWTRSETLHWNDLATDGKIHLTCGGQIRTNQIQVRQPGVPIGFLRIQIIQQRRTAVPIRKRHLVANIGCQRQVFVLVRLQKIHVLDQRPVSGIDIVEDLRLVGVPQTFVAADVDLRARLLALIAVEDAQRNADTAADGVVVKRIVKRRIVRDTTR